LITEKYFFLESTEFVEVEIEKLNESGLLRGEKIRGGEN